MNILISVDTDTIFELMQTRVLGYRFTKENVVEFLETFNPQEVDGTNIDMIVHLFRTWIHNRRMDKR